jgi:hypothetical protein
MYFDIDESIARTGDYSATFTFSYYDSGIGAISIHYDKGSPIRAAPRARSR